MFLHPPMRQDMEEVVNYADIITQFSPETLFALDQTSAKYGVCSNVLLALQEDLSWTTKDFSCGYRCNQSILELFKLMQDKKISEEQRFLELQATLSMGQQIQLGVESKTPAKTYFNKAEILAKRWLKIQGSPQKCCQTAKTIDEMIFAANRRYPTKESLALLQELRKITQRT